MITRQERDKLLASVATAPRDVKDAAVEAVDYLFAGRSVPDEVKGILLNWERGRFAQNKYGRMRHEK